MRFYLDTARMGQACPAALQVQCAAAQLAADDPSLYSLRFLREGVAAWPVDVQQQFPALGPWQGTELLKQRFATALGGSDPSRIFLANQTARLVRIAARVMFRQSTHVLTTDLNWPAWQAIVVEEAQRHGRQVSQVKIANSVLHHGWTAEEIVTHLLRQYGERRCDGLFLPAVSSLGVSLPIATCIQEIRRQFELRFVLVDAAQSFCQMPITGWANGCDLIITGCHKWLGAYLPMGVASAGNSLAAEQFRSLIEGPRHAATGDDPLLLLTEQLRSDHVDRYTETVNALAMLSANAVLAHGQRSPETIGSEYRQRRRNADHVTESLAATAWRPVHVDASVRSAILLARSRDGSTCQLDPETLQSGFRQHGVALSAYPGGLLRFSLPAENFSPDHVQQLSAAMQAVSRQFQPR